MAKIKLADGVGRLNDRYDADLSYQQLYMAAISGKIPAERDGTGRFWLIDEANLPATAKALGLVAVKSKPKPAAKPAAPKRPRTIRSARSAA
jgi:hypothetical protein